MTRRTRDSPGAGKKKKSGGKKWLSNVVRQLPLVAVPEGHKQGQVRSVVAVETKPPVTAETKQEGLLDPLQGRQHPVRKAEPLVQ